jgi:hypothetical protein
MSPRTWLTLFLIPVSLLLAIGLLIAGAIWRGRTTLRSAANGLNKIPCDR